MRPAAARYHIQLILPPDFHAPEAQKLHRFPPQGPAIVAAAVRPDGISLRVIDLELAVFRAPPGCDPSMLDDAEAVGRHLCGAPVPELEALLEELVALAGPLDGDAIAFSLDRHTQVPVAALLAVELKRRTGLPVIIGGAGSEACLALFQRLGAAGVDVVTQARTPGEIRQVFRALRDTPHARQAPPVEPLASSVRSLRTQPRPDDWPTPDFGIYDLQAYRRDALRAGVDRFPGAGPPAPALVLPYSFAFECQFACAFCQTEGTQSSKPIEDVVRDLAAMAERYGASDFVLLDAQINLLAPALARALLEARVELRWSDSYRVRPSPPGDLELMARAGCVGLTFGVESASDRVLKKMIKGHTGAHAARTIQAAHACEIMVRVNLLPCFPGETREDFEQTRDWLREQAAAIDDLAPSSFYLTRESPIGRAPERFGITIRDARTLGGIYRFRKNYRSLAFDEVGGMAWEEREPTLVASEEELRRAWAEGRGESARFGGLRPSEMLALRGRFPTKAEGYAALERWSGGAGLAPVRGDGTSPAPRDAPSAHGAGAGPVQAGSEALQGRLRVRLTAPALPTPWLLARFTEAFRAAQGQLRAAPHAIGAAHAVLFADGDFVFFRGTVDRRRGAGAAAGSLAIEEVLAQRTGQGGDREPLHRRLAAGEGGLAGAGRDYEVVSFLVEP